MKRDSLIIQRMRHVSNGGFNILSNLIIPSDIEDAKCVSVCSVFWFCVFYFVFDLAVLVLGSSLLIFIFILSPIMSLGLFLLGYGNSYTDTLNVYDIGIGILFLYGMILSITLVGLLTNILKKNILEKNLSNEHKPNIIMLFFKSLKDKTCYFIKIED